LDILRKTEKRKNFEDLKSSPSWRGSYNKIEVLQQRPWAIRKPTLFHKMIMLPTEVTVLDEL
jgi:hypothetical protein